MTNRLAAALLLTLCVLPAHAAKKSFKIISAADLAAALESTTPPAVYDANGQSTREDAGVIPGARLLSSSSKYDVAKELPADKKKPLVFYCANTMCMASHSAAKKAVKAGYADVSVMADGIYGWKKAGRPVAALVSPPRPPVEKGPAR